MVGEGESVDGERVPRVYWTAWPGVEEPPVGAKMRFSGVGVGVGVVVDILWVGGWRREWERGVWRRSDARMDRRSIGGGLRVGAEKTTWR